MARFDAAHQYVAKMKEELACLWVQRDEAARNSRAAQLKETELENQYKSLKIKLLDAENKRKSEKVLFAIENLEDTEPPLHRNWQPGKASELLRSEEERTKLPAKLKQLKEKLGLVHKDMEDSSRVCKELELDAKMQIVVLEITEGTRKTMEEEAALNDVIHETETLLEMARVDRSEIDKLVVGYHEKVFESDLKEAEIFICEEASAMVRKIKEMKDTRMREACKRNELVEKNSWFDQHRVEQEFEVAHRHRFTS